MTMRPTIPALGPLALLLAAGACSLDSDSMGRMPTLGGSTGNASTGAQDETATAAELTGEPLPEGPRRRRLDIDPQFVGDVSTTLLVRLDPTRIEYDDTQPDGSDLQFFGPDGITRYPAEIERWEPGGTSVVWVRVIDPALPDHLWMHYADGTGFPPDDPSEVWDGVFSAVWHMVAMGTAFPDSTGEGNPLVAVDFSGELDAEGAEWMRRFLGRLSLLQSQAMDEDLASTAPRRLH